MEASLAIPVILYDFLLRAEAAGEAYYQVLLFALLETIIRQRHNYPAALCRKIAAVLYLNLKDHDQARVLLRGCHVIDAAFGEHGVNALLRIILQGVTSTEQAIHKAKLYFAKRTSEAGQGLLHDFGSKPRTPRYVLGRLMDEAVAKAQTLIGAIVESLIDAENTNQLPRRVPFVGKHFKSDNYICDAFFPPAVLDILPKDRVAKAEENRKFPSHQIGAPAWALNARSHDNRGISPDERQGCHVKGCAATAPLHYLICGHSRCQPCFDRSQHCSDCVEGAAKRIEHVARVEEETERTRYINITELHDTTLTAQEQNEIDEALRVAGEAQIPDDAGVLVGMIQTSKEQSRVKISAALEKALAGRRQRAAAAAGIAHADIVLPIALAGAAAPPVPMEGGNEPPVPGNVRHKRGRVEETEVGPAEQPVAAALCGFTYQGKNGPAVCGQSAACCGYKNHKRWREQKESAPVLSEPVISEAAAPPPTLSLNTHIFFAD